MNFSSRPYRKAVFPYFTPGKTQRPAAAGPSTKHKRNSFYPRSPVPLKCAPSLLWFLFLQLVVSKPLPGIVKVLPESMFSPLLRKNKNTETKHPTVLIFDMCTRLF